MEKNNKANGWGRMISEEGDYYVGWFKDDKRCGYGKYVNATSGKIEEGLWYRNSIKIDKVKYDILNKNESFSKDFVNKKFNEFTYTIKNK